MVSTQHLLIVLGLCCPSIAFSTFSSSSQTSSWAQGYCRRHSAALRSPPSSSHLGWVGQIRGGAAAEDIPPDQQEEVEVDPESAVNEMKAEAEAYTETVEKTILVGGDESKATASSAMVLAPIFSFGKFYANSLEKRPIFTKSVTAGLIFTLSDWLAQRLEGKKEKDDADGGAAATDWKRTISAGLVGLLYFGPAAHAWYEMIFKILPGTSLLSTLQKAALGQLIFGPSFTCIFFGVSLLQSGTFTLASWFSKIRSDLPGAWAAGLGFWPLVDLVSYSSVPKDYIPLFINACSLVWTIYLSLVANRAKPEPPTKKKNAKKGKK